MIATTVGSGTNNEGVSYMVVKAGDKTYIAFIVGTAGLDTVFTVNGDDTRITASSSSVAVEEFIAKNKDA